MKTTPNAAGAAMANPGEGGQKKSTINSELWQACAGPLVNLPAAGTHVVYFPQGHSEQVAASMKKNIDGQIPNYPNLPSKLLCLLQTVTMHVDPETDEVYAQMTLQPVPSFDKYLLLRSDLSMKANKPETEFFCKTLTASDTSTHGGFSVPRRAAEKIFPPLDFTMQRPAQKLVARDLHDNLWTFCHIFRGKPKRHLLTTGWSLFVNVKRLFAGDSVLFIRDEKQQLLLGIRRANRQPPNLSSSVLSSDSMHIGILAAAAHAVANNSPFSVFYNPRASPSEFVIPLAKYYKAVCSSQVSLGMRFRMMFETEESGTRRYMGTITGISDLDSVRWKNSQWRNLQVGWDESTGGERRNRVSVWEIEPVTAPFFICPTPPLFGSKRLTQPGMPDDDTSDLDNPFKRTMPWFSNDLYMKDPQALPGLSLIQWMNMQQNPSSLSNSIQPNYLHSLPGSILQNLAGPGPDLSHQLGLQAPQFPVQNNIQFNAQRTTQQSQQLDQPNYLNPLSSIIQSQQPLTDITQQQRQNYMNQTLPTSQVQAQHLQPQTHVSQNQNVYQQQSSIQNHQLHRHISQNQNLMPSQQPDQQLQRSENQLQLQLLQKLHQQQQSLLAQQSSLQQPSQLQDQQKQMLDASYSYSRSTTASQVLEMPQTMVTSLPQTHIIPQQMTRTNNNRQTNVQFSHPPQQSKHYQRQPGEFSGHMGNNPTPTTNHLSTAGSSLLTGTGAGGGQSGITDDVPSRSTSPSTNNCPNVVASTINARARVSTLGDKLSQSSSTLLNSGGLETFSANANSPKDLQQKPGINSSLNISKSQSHGLLGPQTYLNTAGIQMDYLDSSSSATSAFLPQNDAHIQHTDPLCFNSQSMSFRDTSHDEKVLVDPRNDIQFGANIDSQLGMPMIPDNMIAKGMVGSGNNVSNNLSSEGGMLSTYEDPKEAQPELSSSIVSHSFGVPADMAFNSIDSTINDSSFLNSSAWAPAPQFQLMRTYTKVYKRGAVGRSIDIARYSGYKELEQDLARMFGIEGQLEDRYRIGWKLVYVDHENDVLLVGDDPWEEFVNCVRCIKILSPQEVQQMSLDGDFGDNALPNQACSSSDVVNV